jgi:Bax protein
VEILDLAWSRPGGEAAAPNLAPRKFPKDMDDLETRRRKRVFLRGLLPHVLAANRQARHDRDRLEAALEARNGAAGTLGGDEQRLLRELAERYRVEVGPEDLDREGSEALIHELLRRVDVIPPSLALAQAAVESAWGSSRFAGAGSSVFGQWVFSATAGIAPLLRPDGANYSVARFEGLAEAVRAYFRNLNTFWAYADFRNLRRGMRERGRPLDGLVLAGGLERYSVRRGEYVEELRRVIRGNSLARFDGRRMAAASHAEWRERVGSLLGSSVLVPSDLPPPVEDSARVIRRL